MVKITKTMSPKHKETQSPFVESFVKDATALALHELPKKLATFPTRWPFPKGDLYHWVPLLNRFDTDLEAFVATYELNKGPQTKDFGCDLLEKGGATREQLFDMGFGPEADREVIEQILYFSRILLENCGNRSIYGSSPHLSDLLSSTSLSLLAATLQIGHQLAKRYQASFKRVGHHHRSVNATLLANHYNIDLDRVQQLCLPFSKTITTLEPVATPAANTPATPKGKEKSYFSIPAASPKLTTITTYANDLASLVKGGSQSGKRPSSASPKSADTNWADWAGVRLTYYETAPKEDKETVAAPTASGVPATPTPVRRASTLGRSNRETAPEPAPPTTSRSATVPMMLPETPKPKFDEQPGSTLKVVEIPGSKILETSTHDILSETLPTVPDSAKYTVLAKVRAAKAVSGSVESRRQILAVRLLAITNLAYIYSESTFAEKLMKQDSDEPRRLQLVYQLAELIHPPAEGEEGSPRSLQTVALNLMIGLAQHSIKATDICNALQTNVSHGVLLYAVRMAVTEMAKEDTGDRQTDVDEWLSAIFELLPTIMPLSRAGQELVTAGLATPMAEILQMKTRVAERNYPNALRMLDNMIHQTREGFDAFAALDGMDIMSKLIIDEVKRGSELAAEGKGIPMEYRFPTIDFEIPWYEQESLRWLFKLTHHMMNHGGTLGQNFERLLRNLMDSPELLDSLRKIILNGKVFGSNAWTNAVSVLNDFINNEPTSFAVIAEAGLSRAVLESVMGREIEVKEEPKPASEAPAPAEGASQAELAAPAAEGGASPAHSTHSDDTEDHTAEDFGGVVAAAKDDRPHPPTQEMLDAPRPHPLAAHILLHPECIGIIPESFGAICLSNSGMKMLLESNALESFMEIFESPAHIKIMEQDGNLPHALGAAFDELMRHHPPLKSAIMNATLDMVARVAHLCKKETSEKKLGAKLMTRDATGKVVVADRGLIGTGTVTEVNADVEMTDVDQSAQTQATGTATLAEKSMQPMLSYITIISGFLLSIFTQKYAKDIFLEKGGLEYLLDLAALPIQAKSVPEDRAHKNMQNTIATLADHKPHLVIPSLMKRTQAAADALLGFAQHSGPDAYFGAFVQESKNSTSKASDTTLASGSSLAEAIVTVTNLTGAIYHCLSQPSYTTRAQIGQSFSVLNLGDYYIRLVKSLGPILAASAKEDFKLAKLVPRSWRRSAKHPSIPARGGGVDHVLPSEDTTRDALEQLLPATAAADPSPSIAALTGNITREQIEAVKNVTLGAPAPLTEEEKKSPEYENWCNLTMLFARLMPQIPKFLQALGKVLIGRKAPEGYIKQVNTAIADTIAETVLFPLGNLGDERNSGVYTFWDFQLGVVKSILVNDAVNAERPGEIITFVLIAFMRHGGFNIVNRILEVYADEILVNADKLVKPDDVELLLRNDLATLGVRNILDLYHPITSGKHVADSTQANALTHRTAVERGHPEFFSPGQLVVECRMAILPAVKRIWDSEILEKGSRIIPSRLIAILKQIMLQDHEIPVFKRSDPAIVKQKATKKKFRIDRDAMERLEKSGADAELAKEALFRCNNEFAKASEYCMALKLERSGGRNRLPYDEVEVGRTGDGSGTATPAAPAASARDHALNDLNPVDRRAAEEMMRLMGVSHPQIVPAAAVLGGPSAVPAPSGEQTTLPERVQPPANGPQTLGEQKEYVTIDDLNEARTKMQEDLIDRCLEVISSHANLTFEISDLIFVVISKAKDPKDMRSQVGETLVGALASFMYSDDIRAAGKKVASYAHLLALLLQDKNFYEASLVELSNSLGSLLEFIKLSPDHKSEESSPWIAHILLIVEILLCNDAEPLETEWKIPTLETKEIDKPVLKMRDAVVSDEHREKLFESILDILPRIGKDESLALAVLRILVILTRSRKLATAMGETKNMQRLFVMAKQLSGTNSTRVQSPLMVVLRHIVEDDETIKQIMRAEIRTYLDPQPSRSSRHPDITTFLRNTAHLVDRNPELFVEVTNEMVKLKSWNAATDAAHIGRHQVDLQDKWKANRADKLDVLAALTAKPADAESTENVKPSTEEAAKEEAPKAEHKAPIVENPDGVIHFLLCELMNYRDVEDMEATPPATATSEAATSNTPAGAAGSSPLINPAEAAAPTPKADVKKPKQEFKLEEHPIYLYRCFLLQCLTELLASYNRTKIEFIHFKRNAPTHAATPSKPRSDVVKYLLFDLIPTGCLEHPETIAQRKRVTTSSWADSTLTALLSKTGEQILERTRDNSDSDDEPDLLYVRKFVLEAVLKAFNQAAASTEPLEQKYSRMLSLADLMNHIMSGKDSLGGSDSNVIVTSQRQLKRIMFEKGFLGALTASIADIDLNFPGAKRAVKHILRPLKALTQTAIDLSELGKIAIAPGQQEEDEIESASSVSEVDEDREETPDLFRNSTLGMFEPDRENASSSEDDTEDEEMYEEDGYEEEEMYDEEDMDEEGPISDEEEAEGEDEDMEGMGPIEGLDGDHNHAVEVIMDIDDEDEESGSSSDDDEDDDEDMDDEDDDNRVEIIDEHGNTHALEALDDEDNDWESEEDEEEDEDDEEFHERLVEEEEQHRRGEDFGPGGALGRLIHSFADGPGGDVQGDIDNILQRLGDGNAGPMAILDEFMGDEHDHDHDDEDEGEEDDEEEEDEEMEVDIDDEDDMYQNYELAGEHAGMPFALEIDGGDGAPPVFVSRIGGRGMGRRLMDAPPFPFLAGGPHRDPLGGMLDALLEDDGQASPFRIADEVIVAARRGVEGTGRAYWEIPPPPPDGVFYWNDSWVPPSSGWTPGHRRRARIGEGAATPPMFTANDITAGYDYPYPRSHRHGAGPTPRGGPDTGTNPLLQRGYAGPAAGPATPASPFMNRGQLFDIVSGRQLPPGAPLQTPQGLLNDLFQHMPVRVAGTLAAPVRGAEVRIHGAEPSAMREFQAMFGLPGPPGGRAGEPRSQTSDPGAVSFFTPQQTITRWSEEARLLFGTKYIEAASKVSMAIFAALGPAALEIHKEQEVKRKEALEKAKKAEDERKAKAAKEEEERLAKERKEAEEKEEAERKKALEEAAEAAANPPAPEESSAQPMEDVETTGGGEAATGEAAPDNRPRVTIPFRDGTLDITDLGIDLDYLDALPEEYREEVITGAIAQRRSEAAATGAPSSDIDQEFLDALPDEIRAEIMAQERADRRRRDREEARRAAQANAGAAAPEAIDNPAEFLNALPADMRAEAIALAAQDPDVAGAIPEEFLEQARALFPHLGRGHVRAMPGATPGRSAGPPKPVRRTIVQMLDKAGIATLLRLMFIYQQESLRNTLHQVLQNISENRHNRGEVVSTILHILQDGSADMTAVEKSFAHLSVRAKQPAQKEPKTPLTLSRKNTATSLTTVGNVANADISPLMVVQQCLSALIWLTKVNVHMPSFFLSEHEPSSGSLKRALSKKGKGKNDTSKEARAVKFPLNSLLNLLSRHLIIESSPAMESLSFLLSELTKSLPALERRQKEQEEAAKKEAEAAAKKAEEDKTKPAEEKTEEKSEEKAADGSPMSIDIPAPATGEASTEAAKPEETEKAKEPEKKKPKPFVPPVVPDSNLKLLVGIFVARECSSKTFRDTLSTIKNLSCLPEAKSVFGKELIIKAQELGQTILADLEELLPQIQKASTSTELQGVALAKFSPSGSDQNKLLRVLTALDHLFTSKPKKEGDKGETEVDNEKRDLLASLYQNSTFGSMWDKLSACLTAIRQRENMLNVATILLPLIESLMVVCKNTDLKDPVDKKPTKQLALTSPVPESRMESLFYTFTEEHRKILNDLVRNTPKLMSGTFSLLVKNPKVLEFDNKRNFFTRSVHSRNNPQRQPYPPLQLSIRRDQVFHDSFKSLYFKSGDEMKFGKLSIRFHGEEGIDAGGVTREWFQALSRQMFDPSYALFIPVSSDRTTFHPNLASSINEEHLMFFKFIGRVIGKALYEGRVLDCHFSRAVYKCILGKSVSVKDMESLDPDYYKSITWMLENDITDIITETFSVDNDKFGVVETVDLIPNGRNIPVTEENKQEYVRLMVEFKLIGSVRDQLDNFLKGFHEIIPAELIAIFDEQELELLISGLPEIDIDDWKANTEYHQYTAASPQIQWFWRALRSFDTEERAKMLQFVTGTSKVPLNGFKELEGMNGFTRFNIHRDYGNKDRLPTSHTCFNQLDLPEYESYEMLRQQLLTAITTGADHFGFA